MKKWKILIVTNDKIITEYYQNDKCFNNENWTFFNVSNSKRLESDVYDVVNALDIPDYEFLGKDWAESEVIYNVRRLNLFSDFDYLGIIHWDFNLYSPQHKTYRITENISNILEKYKWISFFPGMFSNISGHYNVLLDERKPNCLFVRDSNIRNPHTANDYSTELLEKYGLKPNREFRLDDVISLCCSFITDRENFLKIGELIGDSVKSGVFNGFDTERRHRIPGQVMERLVAIYQMTVFGNSAFPFQLDHRFTGGQEININDPEGENY